MSGRKDFLNMPAPENYVAGLGRGATGFTTRSDLGPAREGPSEEQLKEALAKRAAQLGQAAPTAYGATEKKDDDDDDERFQDPDNEVGLFANGLYDKDDDEADRIYQEVDERMDKRRKQRREEREKKEREEHERQNPKIAQQFADLKRGLSAVTDDEWANIPEVGDMTGKNRRTKQNLRQRFYAVPDSVLAGARDAMQLDTSISAADGTQTNGSGVDNADGTMTNFADIGAAREKVLQVRLDQAVEGAGTESIAGTSSSIDPKGYLTSLTNVERQNGAFPVEDLKRARVLLESVIKTNPKHAPGWIAAAWLEFEAGKIQAAKNVIARGCERCPKSEDIWIEAIRLNTGDGTEGDNHNAKIIAANAIRHNDMSVRIWLAAMRLENELNSKKRVLRRALDAIPQSVAIWKEAVKLEENPADARLLLARATDLVPLSVELWLALARLESPENAQKVLNKARKAIPTSHDIWLAACRLQEQLGNLTMVFRVMGRAIRSLIKESAMLKREEWITEAEKCEEEGAIQTAGAIVGETLGWNLDEDDDRREIWLDDAKSSFARGRPETARAILSFALKTFVNSRAVWSAAVDLEKSNGTKDSLLDILEKAVQAVPQSEALWLQLARTKMEFGNLDEARCVLGRAFNQNPNNEDIWLAAVKLEADNDETDAARRLLSTARTEAGTDRVWIKSVAFERQVGRTDQAMDLVNQALQRYPKADKLWMMKGQMYEAQSNLPKAREAYNTGTRACPKSVALWLLTSRLEERAGLAVKARSVLDRARQAIPKNDRILCEAVRLEWRSGNVSAANQLMAQALQQNPASGLLWSEKIWHLEARTQRKPRCLEAIRKVDNDPLLFVSIARIFWAERRLEKAMTWFEKALVLDSDLGDTWAWYYKFLLQHGEDVKREEVISKYLMAEPKHGEVFQGVHKDPKNAGKSLEEVLKIVVTKLE